MISYVTCMESKLAHRETQMNTDLGRRFGNR